VADRDLALMNTIDRVFSDVYSLLCRYRVTMNVNLI
jgi:hypothetical protein